MNKSEHLSLLLLLSCHFLLESLVWVMDQHEGLKGHTQCMEVTTLSIVQQLE